jgi:hypothetical protein
MSPLYDVITGSNVDGAVINAVYEYKLLPKAPINRQDQK